MDTWQEHPSPATPDGSSDPAGDELTSVRFAEAAREIARAASALGLTTPAFRSPPRQPGLRRSITRRPDGSATVSVAIRGRPAVAVVADMIDGVMAANESGSTGSVDTRDRLWSAATPCLTARPPARRSGAAQRRSVGRATPAARGRPDAADRRAA